MKTMTIPEVNVLKKILETKSEIDDAILLYEQFWGEKAVGTKKYHRKHLNKL